MLSINSLGFCSHHEYPIDDIRFYKVAILFKITQPKGQNNSLMNKRIF